MNCIHEASVFCTERYTTAAQLLAFVCFVFFLCRPTLHRTYFSRVTSPPSVMVWSKSSICLHLSEGGGWEEEEEEQEKKNKIWRSVVHALGSSFLIIHVFCVNHCLFRDCKRGEGGSRGLCRMWITQTGSFCEVFFEQYGGGVDVACGCTASCFHY